MTIKIFHKYPIVLTILLLFLFSMVIPPKTKAVDECSALDLSTNPGDTVRAAITFDAGPLYPNSSLTLPITIDTTRFDSGNFQIKSSAQQNFAVYQGSTPSFAGKSGIKTVDLAGTNIFSVGPFATERKKELYLLKNDSMYCHIGSYEVAQDVVHCGPDATKTIWQERTIGGNSVPCYLDAGICKVRSEPVHILITGLMQGNDLYTGDVVVQGAYTGQNQTIHVTDGTFDATPSNTDTNLQISLVGVQGECAELTWDAQDNCPDASCQTDKITHNGSSDGSTVNFDLCSQVAGTAANSTSTAYSKCINCQATNGIWTAVGCIETKPQSIIQAVVKIGVGIGGGIALLMTLVGGFLLTTSQGDPKRTQEGKEMITSSVIGILFVLFSVVILQFIGVTIFRIPGFGT